jgi:hypothetical protein
MSRADLAEIATSASSEPRGFGLAVRCQAEPFQCSIKGRL